MKISGFFVSFAAGLASGHFSHGPNDIHTAMPGTASLSITTQGSNIFATHTIIHVAGGGSFTMTNATQTHRNVKYVDDPLNKWRLYNFQKDAAIPTGSCDMVAANATHHKKHKHDKDSRHPHHDRRAIDDEVDHEIARHDNFTSLVEKNPPKTEHDKKHNKHKHNKHRGKESPQCQTDRCMWEHFFKPALLDNKTQPQFQRGFECRDLQSCNDWCFNRQFDADDSDWNEVILFIVLTILALILLGLLAALCLGLLRRRHNKRKDQDQPAPGVAPQATGGAPIVTQVVEERHDDPAGGAGGAGGASGSGGNEKVTQSGGGAAGGDDGKGTTGKRAEEGRGQVQFEDGGHPGSETHVETKEAKPAGQMDGAVSGWEVPGMGSVRGRRLQRMGLGGMM